MSGGYGHRSLPSDLFDAAGFFRGIWIPLFTISAVRAASFTMYTSTKEFLQEGYWLDNSRLAHVALGGASGGAISGSVISVGSARKSLTHTPS